MKKITFVILACCLSILFSIKSTYYITPEKTSKSSSAPIRTAEIADTESDCGPGTSIECEGLRYIS